MIGQVTKWVWPFEEEGVGGGQVGNRRWSVIGPLLRRRRWMGRGRRSRGQFERRM